MRAVVVYESMYGNTRQVAEKVREGIAETWDADLRGVDDSSPFDASRYGLIVLGGPTHGFGMSTPQSRHEAHGQDTDAREAGSGIREWIPNLGTGYAGKLAVFDTRMTPGWLPGLASRAIRRRLRRANYKVLARRSFVVTGKRGPLRDGELYAARAWGAELAVRARTRTAQVRRTV